MKRAVLTILFSVLLFLYGGSAFGQQTVTPNINLQVPAYQQVNWQVPIDYDLGVLDTILGGVNSLPTGVTPTITQGPVWITGNTSPTSITNFLGVPFEAETITLICGSGDTFTSVVNSANVALVTSPWTCSGASPTLQLTYVNGVWTEIARGGSGGGSGGGTVVNGNTFLLGLPTVGVSSLGISVVPQESDATVQAGADACAKINTNWTAIASAVSPLGGVNDARGFSGQPACAASPLTNNTTLGGLLLLGGSQLQAATPWIAEQGIIIQGESGHPVTAPLGGQRGAAIQATSSFPSNSTLFTVGTTTNNGSVSLRDIRLSMYPVSGSNPTGGTVYSNIWGQEGTSLYNVFMDGGCVADLSVGTAQMQNMGPIIGLTTGMNGCNSTSSVNAQIGITGTSSAIANTTIMQFSGGGTTNAAAQQNCITMDFVSDIWLESGHCEQTTVGIEIGSGHVAHNIGIVNFSGLGTALKPMTSIIDISAAGTPPGGDDILLMNILANGSTNLTNILKDNSATNPCTIVASVESELGWYWRSQNGTFTSSKQCPDVWPAHNENFAASTINLPQAVGFTPTATSDIGTNTTNNALMVWDGGAPAFLAAFPSAPTSGLCVATTGTIGLLTTTSCGGLTFPAGVGGTTNSGGIPYFSNITTLSSSGLLAAGGYMIGGGAGQSPFTDASRVILNSVTSHNAVAIIANGNMTATSAVLTCSTCTFTSGNVGEAVSIGLFGSGPGPSGAPLVTTIATFTDSHHVNLATTASSTVTNQNLLYGTDDTAGINAALTALAFPVCGTLEVNAANFYISNTVTIPPCVNIFVNGTIGEGGSSQNTVNFYGAATAFNYVQFGTGLAVQFNTGQVTNLAVADLFSIPGNNGFFVDGASNGTLTNTMAFQFNGVGSAGYLLQLNSGQASTWQFNNIRAYDCTTCVDASAVNVDGPTFIGGEMVVKNTNTAFTGQPVGIVGSTIKIFGTHVIPGQNAGATQDAVGVKLVNAGGGNNVQAKIENGGALGHGIGVWYSGTSTRGYVNSSCSGLALCGKFDSTTGNISGYLNDSGGNNTQMIADATTGKNHVSTQTFLQWVNSTVANLPVAANTPTDAFAWVSDGASGSDCTTGGGSTWVLCRNTGAAWTSAVTGSGGSLPLTTLGDTVYENATPAPARLPGNTSTTMAGYTQTGNGTISAAPAWTPFVGGGASPVAATVTSPAQTQILVYNASGILVNSYSGVNVDPQTGNYTLACPTDRLGEVEFNITVASTLTVPQAGSTSCLQTNMGFVVRNTISSTALLTISLTTSTFQPEGTSTLVLSPGAAVFIYSDATTSTGNYHDIPIATAPGGVNVQTTTYTVSLLDKDKLIVMNCSSACTVNFPATPPSAKFWGNIVSIGSTLATVGLGGTQFNGSATAPTLVTNSALLFYTNGTNYFGSIPTSGGSSAFASLTSGTNTTAAMVVGSGASLSATGSGSIAATAVPWSGLTNPAANLGPLTMGTFTSTWAYTSGLSNAWLIENTTAATVSAAQSSPQLVLAGTDWTGAGASTLGSITIQYVPATGLNAIGLATFTLTDSSTNGNNGYNFPSGNGLYTNNTGGSYNVGPSGSRIGQWAGNALYVGSGGRGIAYYNGANIDSNSIDTTLSRAGTGILELGSGTSVGANGSLELATALLGTSATGQASTQSVTYQGGVDASANSVLGSVTLRGANETGAGGATSAGGGVLVEGGTNAATNAASEGGSIEILPGVSTGSTQGLQGLYIQLSVYVKGTTVTQWNLECPTAAMTAADCGASPANVLGVAEAVNTNTVQVSLDGQVPINASAAVTLGHTVCAGSTAGKVTDSGGTATCTNAQGAQIGVVMATSGTWTLPDGNSFTASTTLPLVQLSTYTVATPSGGGVALNAVTAAGGTATIANGNNPIVWNWAQTTNSQSAFTFGETTAATGTSDIELNIQTLSTSTAAPLQVTAGGTANGIKVTTTGLLEAIGSGAFAIGGTAHGVLLSEGATTAVNASAVGNSGAPFLSGGSGADGAYGALNLAGGSNVVTGTLPAANVANIPLNQVISPASAPATFANGNFPLVFNFALTTASASAFTFGETSAGTSTGTPFLVNINTLSGSTLNPLVVTAVGTANGLEVTKAAVIEAIGTGAFAIGATVHGVVLSEGATTAVNVSAVGTSGAPFLSGGSGADGAYGALNLGGGSSIVTGTLPAANVANIPLNQVISATGGIATIADGNHPLTLNCAQTTASQACVTFGETTAANAASDVELQITTLTTTTAIPLQITQGAAGPANSAAPNVVNVTAAAAGGAAGASNAGSAGAAYTWASGAGSAGGATTGNGGAGGAWTVTEGAGGTAGGTATNNGGNGGGVAWTTGAGGNGGSGAGTAGSGGGITFTLGAPGTNSSTGTAGTVGQFLVTGNSPATTANAAGVASGTIFSIAGVTGGASSNAAGTAGVGSIVAINSGAGGAGTGTNTVGGAGGGITITSGAGGASAGTGANANGGNVTVTLGIAGVGGSGTAGATGEFLVTGTAPASSSTTTGLAVGTLFSVAGVTGGATSNAAGTAGIGSLVSILTGNGGAGTGTNAVGGAGGGMSLTAGNGGASAGTGANSNGGSITLTPGTAGTGGSGAAGQNGVVSFAGSGAGAIALVAGTDNSGNTLGCSAASTFCLEAPSSIGTSYTVLTPTAKPTNNNSAMLFSNASPGVGTFAKMPQTVQLTSQYTNSTTSFTNVTGGNSLAFSVEASTSYTGSCVLYYQAASTGGLNIEFTGPASPTNIIYGLIDPGSSTTLVVASVATAYSTSLGAAVTTATTNFPAIVNFSLQNGTTAGTLQMLAKSSAAVQLQIQNGSYCTMQ